MQPKLDNKFFDIFIAITCSTKRVLTIATIRYLLSSREIQNLDATSKKYASCLKYATNCRFLPILKKGKAQKSLILLSFYGKEIIY